MTIVMLAFEPNLMSPIQTALEEDGYTVLVTRDAEEALSTLEHNAEPCILLADNFLVSPVAVEALPRLAADAELRKRVRVIGLSAWAGDAVEEGTVDAVVTLPFTLDRLFDAIDATHEPRR